MSSTFFPKNYKPLLNLYKTQEAISLIKNEFQIRLANNLNLKRVSSPLFVDSLSGLNDNLSGNERPVRFDIANTNINAEVVHSLAKWKRYALAKYRFSAHEGLYTDMNAIRRDEELDNIHSVYVDQWDWEKVITPAVRNLSYLKETVRDIVCAIFDTNELVKKTYGTTFDMQKEVTFITSQQLEDLYPNLTAKERENAITKKHKTVFIMQIGDKLNSGNKHDNRAPDYDDWSLNGDILIYNDILDMAIELSSMGIRVDKPTLLSQLEKSQCMDRITLPFHKALLNEELPLTMGGGIGQSRLCMMLLQKSHIGEVQCSIWDEDTLKVCKEFGVELL